MLRKNRYPYLLLLAGILLSGVQPGSSQDGDQAFQRLHGAIVRGDTGRTELALVFTGDSYADGGSHIARVLAAHQIKASFFLTGNFYRNPEFDSLIHELIRQGHYLGAHSDRHLLYCSWEDRDSLLLGRKEFRDDLMDNYRVMEAFGIKKKEATYFLPPFEWYNDTIATWTRDLGLQLVNFTSGTLSHADYTLPEESNYRNSREIYRSILDHEKSSPGGLKGFILLVHIGSAAERTDKFYLFLDDLVNELKSRAYEFKRIDELLK